MLATVSLHVEATINASRTLKVAEARRWTLNLKRRSREAASRYDKDKVARGRTDETHAKRRADVRSAISVAIL